MYLSSLYVIVAKCVFCDNFNLYVFIK